MKFVDDREKTVDKGEGILKRGDLLIFIKFVVVHDLFGIPIPLKLTYLEI